MYDINKNESITSIISATRNNTGEYRYNAINPPKAYIPTKITKGIPKLNNNTFLILFSKIFYQSKNISTISIITTSQF